MTAEEFTELVRCHDVTYNYSDDHRVWCRGDREKSLINQARKELGDDICVPIWNAKIDREFAEEHRKDYYWKKKGDT